MNPLKFALVCLLPASLLLPSCKPEEQTVAPALKLSQTEISVPASGGTVSLDYSLENPVEGSVISVDPVSEVDWITDIDLSVAEKISFNVVANEVEEIREAEFIVSYPGLLEEVSFTVIQQASEPVPAPFEIIVKDVQTSSITFDIIALDKEMDYIFFMSPADYVAQFPDDDALFNDDMAYFDQEGIALADAALRGDQIDYEQSPVLPATAFTCYAYGVDVAERTRLTDIVRVDVSSGEIPMVDVNFDVEIEVSGATVIMNVDPGSYEGYYYMNLVEGLDPDQAAIVQTCYQIFYEDIAAYIGIGLDTETILMLVGEQGPASVTFDMEPEKEYTAVVFAVDDVPQLCSEPYCETVRTEAIQPSDNVITIDVTDITAHTANLSITTTNNDSYYWAQLEESTYGSFATDEDLLNFIVTYMPIYSTYSGNYSTQLYGLNSKTNYMIIAFGYSGGTVTTSLFKKEFSTPQEQLSDVEFSVYHDKWYAIEDVAAIDPTYEAYVGGWDCLLPLEARTDFEAVTEYYYATYDFNSIIGKSDEEIKMDLMNNYYPAGPSNVSISSYESQAVVVGFAIDKEGNYTSLYRSAPFTLTEEGASHDGQEFVDWYYSFYGAVSPSAMKEPQPIRVYKPESVKKQQ